MTDPKGSAMSDLPRWFLPERYRVVRPTQRPAWRPVSAAVIDAINDCLDSRRPSRWEKQFLQTILDDFRVISGRQQAVLERICEECGVVYPE